MSITYGGDNISDSNGGVLRPISSVMRNRIINGAMVIDQRNAGASVTAVNGTYTLDRFQTYSAQASKFSVQQNAGSVTPPVGFTKYLGATSLSAYSVTSTDYFYISQKIEGYNVADLGWGTANAKTITISFQVYSSLTGTFGAMIGNGAQDRSYPFSYTISSANTWTTINVTVAGDTTGTWATDNSTGLYLYFTLGSGSTRQGTANTWAGAWYIATTGSTNVVGTNGATFYITGVQLEVGSSATGFEYRQYGQELALCQRYARTVTDQMSTGGGASSGASTVVARFPFPVTMRSAPTASFSTAGSFILGNDYSANYTASSASVSSANLTFGGGRIAIGGFSGLPASGTFLAGSDATGSGVLLLSAEL